jgi:outer membrane usher protein FimD/PapC
MKKSIVVVAMAVLVIMGLGAAAGAVTGATDLANKRDIALDNKLMEITAGNIYTNTDSLFLKSSQIGGVTLSRKYTINPIINPYNSLDQRLTLTTKSRVELYRNERLVATQEMGPGIYDLKNLPVAGFSGNLKIKIVDAYGQDSTLETSVSPAR